ncbi:MAG: baseplate J/gp47 family protein, partial [Anaerovorax sp.]
EDGQWRKWQEVSDFALSGPDDRHYMVDRNLGMVMFANNKNGKIPDSGARETICINYNTGGGNIGNLGPDMVNRMNLNIGFINTVTNPQVTSGGCDIETVEESVLRSAASLKHRYRGVTAKDYETLAFEATRNIKKAKCFAGYDERGEKAPGSVTLAVLQKDFNGGRSYFGAVKEQVQKYISERISGDIADLDRFCVV